MREDEYHVISTLIDKEWWLYGRRARNCNQMHANSEKYARRIMKIKINSEGRSQMNKISNCKECAKKRLANQLLVIDTLKHIAKSIDELIVQSNKLLHELSEKSECNSECNMEE